MEYCSNGELFDFIVKKRRLKEPDAAKIYLQILCGIEYLSKLRIVHRDLKPENMLLDYNNNIRIVDFGLSNTYKEQETLKTACVSPCYAAPEMIAGKRYHGTGVDIWSSGVILFAMICGFLPFEHPNTKKLYKKIIDCDYTIPKYVSDDARDLITRILNTNPEKRLTLSQIRDHPFFQGKYDEMKNHEGIIVGTH